MEEKLLYKNTSKMDKEEVSMFQGFAMKKNLLILSICFTLIFVGIGVGVSFIELTFGIITIVCGVLGGFVLLPYLMKEQNKKQNDKAFSDKKYLNTFEFYAEHVQITTETALASSNKFEETATQKVQYNDFVKGVLYKQRLYLYINSNQCFIINYLGMTKGTIGEVIELLKEKNINIVDKSQSK